MKTQFDRFRRADIPPRFARLARRVEELAELVGDSDDPLRQLSDEQLEALIAALNKTLGLPSVQSSPLWRPCPTTTGRAWRDRAQEIRAIGDRMHDDLARQEMMRLASKYERLAEWAEQRDLA
jgi:hypothetical protein